jgi:hypothetical protein
VGSRKARKDEVLSVRLTSAEAAWLREKAQHAGTTVSVEARRIITTGIYPTIICNGVRVQ